MAKRRKITKNKDLNLPPTPRLPERMQRQNQRAVTMVDRRKRAAQRACRGTYRYDF